MMSKEKFQIEFLAKSSPNILYNQIATVSGLSEWFADNVNIKEDILLFTWDGEDEEAKLIARKKDQFIKFEWLELEGEGTYVEMRIVIDPLTKDLALVITDFCEPMELEESKELWKSQIDQLFQSIGA
ncbi:MAG: SRPBCC domain-containing protein [Flavobacteriales bacterium]|nr:SRPBCC domain-containing protein [Flavobacteriales bacterium]